MSQSVLEKHRDLREALRGAEKVWLTMDKVVPDPEHGPWRDVFCEVYDELEHWVGVIDQDHGVEQAWLEFCGDQPPDIIPDRVAFFLTWLVRRVNAL